MVEYGWWVHVVGGDGLELNQVWLCGVGLVEVSTVEWGPGWGDGGMG